MDSLGTLTDFTAQTKDEVKRRIVADELAELNSFGEKVTTAYNMALKTEDDLMRHVFLESMIYELECYVRMLLNMFRVLAITHVPPVKISNTLMKLFDFFIENYGDKFSENVKCVIDFLKDQKETEFGLDSRRLKVPKLLDTMECHSDGIEELTNLMLTIMKEENLLDFVLRSKKLEKETVGLGK